MKRAWPGVSPVPACRSPSPTPIRLPGSRRAPARRLLGVPTSWLTPPSSRSRSTGPIMAGDSSHPSPPRRMPSARRSRPRRTPRTDPRRHRRASSPRWFRSGGPRLGQGSRRGPRGRPADRRPARSPRLGASVGAGRPGRRRGWRGWDTFLLGTVGLALRDRLHGAPGQLAAGGRRGQFGGREDLTVGRGVRDHFHVAGHGRGLLRGIDSVGPGCEGPLDRPDSAATLGRG